MIFYNQNKSTNHEGNEKQAVQGSDRTSTGTYSVREERSERADAEMRRLSLTEVG